MTQEEKQLLLKDLCARLPYGVKGRVYAETTKGEYDINGDMIFYDSPFDVTLDTVNTSTEEIHVIAIGNDDTVDFIEDQQTDGKPYTVDEFKPYLRPMSTMTREEKCELVDLLHIVDEPSDITEIIHLFVSSLDGYNWLNKKGFDYRGLIPMGLALEAPAEMYKKYLEV